MGLWESNPSVMPLGEAVKCCTPDGDSPIDENITSLCSDPSSMAIMFMVPWLSDQGPNLKMCTTLHPYLLLRGFASDEWKCITGHNKEMQIWVFSMMGQGGACTFEGVCCTPQQKWPSWVSLGLEPNLKRMGSKTIHIAKQLLWSDESSLIKWRYLIYFLVLIPKAKILYIFLLKSYPFFFFPQTGS